MESNHEQEAGHSHSLYPGLSIKTEQPEYNKQFPFHQPRYEEESGEEGEGGVAGGGAGGGAMLCDNMMASYSAQHHASLGQQQDSLARISSMTNSISPPLHSHGSLSPGTVSSVELQTRVRKDFTIMEKAPSRALSWFKALSHFTHY